MSRHILLLAIILYALVWSGLWAVNGAVLALALPFVIYLGAAIFFQPEEPKLRVTREQSASRIAYDGKVVVKLTITNQGGRLDEVTVKDLVPPPLVVVDGAARMVAALAPGQTVEMEYTLEGRRGFYQFPGVEVVAGDRQGLFSRRATLDAPGRLFVLPEVVRLREVDIRPRQTRVYAGSIPARQGGPGVEFFGVRAYQPGDPLRWLNARATARHEQSLFVNEFEQERAADVGLILDARLRGNVRSPAGSLFEHAVEATAALADVFLKRGNRVGLVMYAATVDWTFPGYGNVQRERILRALARARTYDRADVKGLDLLPARLFPTRSQLVFISPLQEEDLPSLSKMRARDYQVLVISPDPIPFEQAALGTSRDVELAAGIAGAERALLMRKLRRMGITVVDWQVGTPFHQVAREALERRGAPRVMRRM
jgi:uncharacterized protein (DUF58 family)